MSFWTNLFRNFRNAPSETALESLLKKSLKDPSFRGEFYKQLLSEHLIVITEPGSSQNLEQVRSFKILTLEDGRIPIFTSPDRIFDKGVMQGEVQTLKQVGKDLFQNLKEKTFVLNPFSDCSKELYPEEISLVINASYTGSYSQLTNSSHQIEIPEKTTVGIGQPAVYPTEIVDALRKLFIEDLTSVKAAYMGWVCFSPEDLPHLIFGLDIEGDAESVINKAISTAQLFLKPEEMIDFIQISSTSGAVASYLLNETKPFYLRQY